LLYLLFFNILIKQKTYLRFHSQAQKYQSLKIDLINAHGKYILDSFFSSVVVRFAFYLMTQARNMVWVCKSYLILR